MFNGLADSLAKHRDPRSAVSFVYLISATLAIWLVLDQLGFSIAWAVAISVWLIWVVFVWTGIGPEVFDLLAPWPARGFRTRVVQMVVVAIVTLVICVVIALSLYTIAYLWSEWHNSKVVDLWPPLVGVAVVLLTVSVGVDWKPRALPTIFSSLCFVAASLVMLIAPFLLERAASTIKSTNVSTYVYQGESVLDEEISPITLGLCEPSRASSRSDAFRCILPVVEESKALAVDSIAIRAIDRQRTIEIIESMDPQSPVAIVDPCFLDSRATVPEPPSLPSISDSDSVSPPELRLGCPSSMPGEAETEVTGVLYSAVTYEQEKKPALRAGDLELSTFWQLRLENGRTCRLVGRIPIGSVGGTRIRYVCVDTPENRPVQLVTRNTAGKEFDGEYTTALEDIPGTASFVVGKPDTAKQVWVVDYLPSLENSSLEPQRVFVAWR